MNYDAYLSGRYPEVCQRKQRYDNPVAATRGAYHLEECREFEFFDVYKCRFCGFWHIGHSQSMMVVRIAKAGTHG